MQTLAEPGAVYLSEGTLRLVDGLVETSFAGAGAIKGKAEPQRVYRLEAIRRGAARFDAALGRGLSAYVGRDREMEILELAFAAARENLRVVDMVAKPGMGKSRLAHEFQQRIANERAFVLIGNSSPDGQQTPFLPFIEVVRGAFQVRAGEAEDEIARKLVSGLDLLSLHTLENVDLLLNLLGLKPSEGALVGLDGVLIGLRTRDLLQAAARCRLSPVVLLLAELHWIDSVSQEVLGTIVANEANLRLLILHTRRLEFLPPWRETSVVTVLSLAPLPAGDIRRLAETRLGVATPPENLARQLIDKAEGNALFAEEILSFLDEARELDRKFAETGALVGPLARHPNRGEGPGGDGGNSNLLRLDRAERLHADRRCDDRGQAESGRGDHHRQDDAARFRHLLVRLFLRHGRNPESL